MSSAAKPAVAMPEPIADAERPSSQHQAVRRALTGFLLSGMLLAFPGAILPAWKAHLTLDFANVGKYFLVFSLGIVFGLRPARALGAAKGHTTTLVSSCLLAAAGFIFLIFVPPPSIPLWRLGGMLTLGVAAALLNTGLFHAILPLYHRDRAATVNLAGALFGIGCLSSSLLVALAFYAIGLAAALALFAAIATGFAVLFARTRLVSPVSPQSARMPSPDWKGPLSLLVGMLLFFQIGSEWSIAGWLPIFIIRRLGSSPAASLLMLAFFWAALLTGRFVVQAILPHSRPWKLLVGAGIVEALGYFLLTMTNNRFGACVGILSLAAGFALVYPLVARTAGNRIGGAAQHNFFDSTFVIAFTSALITPWVLGYPARAWGIGVVMIFPFLATAIVFVLLLVLMIEAFLSTSRSSA